MRGNFSSARMTIPISLARRAPAARSSSSKLRRVAPTHLFRISSTIGIVGAGRSCSRGTKTEGRAARCRSPFMAAANTVLFSLAGPIKAARRASGVHSPATCCMPSHSGPAWRHRAPARLVIASNSGRPSSIRDQEASCTNCGTAKPAACHNGRATRSISLSSSRVAPRSCSVAASICGPSLAVTAPSSGASAERGIRPSVRRHCNGSIRAPSSGMNSRRMRLAGRGGRRRFRRGKEGPRSLS